MMFEARSKSSTVVEEAFVGSSQRPSPNTNGPAATTVSVYGCNCAHKHDTVRIITGALI